jgi:hypothetical protein
LCAGKTGGNGSTWKPLASASSAVSFNYAYNPANQRTRSTLGRQFRVYEYDMLGQVKSGKRYRNDGTLIAGQQFEYAFDDIGNRKTTAAAGGDAVGSSLRLASYSANRLNLLVLNTTSFASAHIGTNVTHYICTDRRLWTEPQVFFMVSILNNRLNDFMSLSVEVSVSVSEQRQAAKGQ